MDARPIDALLLVSFGGPERPEDVVPFLENVTRGRGIPRERLEEVGQHYFLFGGRSPINELNRELIDAIRADFAAHDLDLPVYWGNRNWDPHLRDALRQMDEDGVRNAAYFVTSAYSSYSGCRQYREDLFEAGVGLDVQLTRLGQYWDRDGFVTPFVEATRAELSAAPEGTHVVFVTHSIPEAMNAASGGPGVGAYLAQHRAVAARVAEAAGVTAWSLAFCSRSGSPHVPWLEPDVNDHLEELADQGVRSVVVVPIGFVSDHMEVIYDLDTEAAATAKRLGLRYERADTPGTHPAFVALVRELLLDAPASACPVDCCANARGPLPTVS